MRAVVSLLVCSLALLGNCARADIIVLYNGTGTPASQPWLAFAADGLGFTQTAQAGGVQLTSSLDVSAGYSNYGLLGSFKNPAFPTLNRQTGYELSFALAVNSEVHTSTDRAGFSVTLLGHDSKGIELGFWQDQIWAQSGPLFQHAETFNLDTTVARNYRLRIQDDSYSLFEGGNLLLSNSLRDYSLSLILPYTLPNFLFLGDNTSRGSANVLLGNVTLQTNLAAVPEPTSLMLLTAACGLSVGRLRLVRRRPGRVT